MTDIQVSKLSDDGNSPEKNGCTSEVNMEEVGCQWTIQKFSLCPETITSSTFSVGGDTKFSWYLKLKLNASGATDDDEDYVSLFLNSANGSEVTASYTMSILSKAVKSHPVKRTANFKRYSESGCSRWIKRNALGGLISDDELKIVCHVAIVAGGKFKIPASRLPDDYDTLLQTGKFSDITLVVNDREFTVHKAILSARSPVFCAMFSHDMAEKQSDRIKLEGNDIVFEEFLRFIYTGQAPNLELMACDLLTTADKYGVERLKSLCEEAIVADLAADNVADALMLADLHSAVQLKARAIDVINANAANVMDTAGWKRMYTAQPRLIADAYCVLVTNNPDPIAVKPV